MKFLKIIQKSAKSAIMLDILVGVSFALVACGSESGAEPKSISTVFEVNTKFELGKCTNELEGTSVYVMQENVNYTCLNGSWIKEEGVVTSSFSGLFSSSYYLWSSSSFIQEMINSSSGIQSFIYSSSDPAQNIRATSGFYVRFIPNIDSTSGWMPAQTFFPEIPQYLEKNKYKRNYCSFQGWALSSEGEVVYKDGASVIVSSDVNLYAKWYCWEPSFISSSSFSSSSIKYLSSSSIAYGQLTDDRDGKVYKTVVIGRQTWMAENLDYDYRSYGCRHDSCSVFGRFYSWSSAMDSVAKFSKNGAGCGVKKHCSPTYPVRGICPSGWHLPTKNEFETMLNFVGTDWKSRSEALRITGSEMYARGIRNDYGWAGDNTYGFSIIRTSGDIESGYMNYELYASAYFWASTDPEGDENWQDSDMADCLSVIISSAVAGTCIKYKYVGMSVRCIKNSD